MARKRGMARGKVLTALAKIEDEAPLHVGAAHQILCHLDGVDSLGANFALFGAQPLTLVAEYAGRGKQRVWHEPWTRVGLLTTQGCSPPTLHSPTAITGEARRALGQATALVDTKGRGMAGHRVQAGTELSCDTAPRLMLVGAYRAGLVAGALEVEVAAGDAGSGVIWLAAAPQAFYVAALPPSCTGQAMGTRAHCGQSAVQ